MPRASQARSSWFRCARVRHAAQMLSKSACTHRQARETQAGLHTAVVLDTREGAHQGHGAQLRHRLESRQM